MFVFVPIGQPWNRDLGVGSARHGSGESGAAVGGADAAHQPWRQLLPELHRPRRVPRATPDSQMFAPYGRMFVLHIAIVLGGALVIWQGQPLFAVVSARRPEDRVRPVPASREHGTRADDQGTTGRTAWIRRAPDRCREAAVIDRVTPKPSSRAPVTARGCRRTAGISRVVIGYRAPEPAATGVVADPAQPLVALDVYDPGVATRAMS